MGTRSGDVDPAVIGVIMAKRGYTDVTEFVNVYLNKKSGLKGLCKESDMRKVTEKFDGGDDNARLALEMFAYRVRKYIGSYAAALNGVDCIVMTGGIGENSDEMRARILENSDYLGIVLDKEANKATHSVLRLISAPESKVKVYVIPTNEELVIARDTYSFVK